MAALAFAVASNGQVITDLAPLNSNLQVRNAPGASSTDTLRLLHRSLAAASLKRDTDTVFKNSTSLNTSWDGAVLFSVSRFVHIVANRPCAHNTVCSDVHIVGLRMRVGIPLYLQAWK